MLPRALPLALPLSLTLGLLLGASPAARASLLIDWDAGRITYRNDGDPAVVGQAGGTVHRLGSEPPLALPLSPAGALRFPPCLALPAALRGDCEPPPPGQLAPAGPAELRLTLPLTEALREAYLPLWERLVPPVSPEQEQLEEALRTLERRLAGTLHHRELAGLLTTLEQAIGRAEAVAVQPALLAGARRGAGMAAALADLWRLRNTLSSRDLTLPCDALERRARQFNEAAESAAVRLHRQRPPGICLFCGNVCTVRSADRLLADMKASLLGALGEWSEQEETREGLRRSP